MITGKHIAKANPFSKKSKLYNRVEALKGTERAVYTLVWSSIVGEFVGSFLYGQIDGDEDDRIMPRARYNPYSILGALQYTLGGLPFAVQGQMADTLHYLSEGLRQGRKMDMAIVFGGKLIDTLIPFYDILLDAMETVSGKRNIDLYAVRQVRQYINEKKRSSELYQSLWSTPQYKAKPWEAYTMNRDLGEKFRKLLGTESGTPVKKKKKKTSGLFF
jgi:hypothetical protein